MGACVSSTVQRSAASTVDIHPKRLGTKIENLSFPNYWAIPEGVISTPFRRCVECQWECPDEVRFVQDLINNTMSDGERMQITVERLVRVQDSEMWGRFESAVSLLSEVRNQDTNMMTPHGTPQDVPKTSLASAFRIRASANEAYLFHGTDRYSAEKIIAEDFNTKRAGSAHAMSLGRGIYLAEDAGLADKYSQEGQDGLRTLLLVRAALGKVYVAKRYSSWRGKKLVRAVSSSKLVRSGAYDSVMGDRRYQFNDVGIREYVVPNPSQLYPEYVVYYSCRELKPSKVSSKESSSSSSRSQPKSYPAASEGAASDPVNQFAQRAAQTSSHPTLLAPTLPKIALPSQPIELT
eukprot:TRINITY_DN2804_c0_g3_i1.p1 TRINITY_DN2804_c0_g3~~TRINITY_DN2804_c0_g3_i1.p1  ORF type:complete len:350 (-),score=43.89 TRINITY_DN2804_c0_g3_i1:191-1240(-)